MYDLVLRGGRVLDPGRGLDARLEIGIREGRIAAIEPALDPGAARVIELKDELVVPGLIDLHVHVVQGAATPGLNEIAAPPDLAGVQSGVTTLVDAGTTGAWNFGVFPRYVVGSARTRLLCMLNVGKLGMPGQALRKPEIYTPDDVDLDATVEVASRFSELIPAVKLRLVGPALETLGVELVRLGREAARETGRPLMVHLGDLITRSERAGEVTRELLRALEPGDILTHVWTPVPGGLLDGSGKVLPELREADARGVICDPAHGRSGLSFEVARRVLDQGFRPETISTDLTLNGRLGPIYSLTETMSKFLALGFTLDEVVRMTSDAPARVLGRSDELGAIAVGRAADLSILGLASGRFKFTDSNGAHCIGERALFPVHTVRAGELIAPDWGPHPWGWLPEPA